MSDVLIGVLVAAIGLLLCLRGAAALRFVIATWGALVGFGLGAGLASPESGFLTTTMAWVVAIVLALVFAVLAYVFYAVGVILALGSFGYAVGAAAMSAIGMPWSWVVTLVAVAVGVAFALAGLALNLPMALLSVVSALMGAAVAVTGAMLVVGAIGLAQLSDPEATAGLRDEWWWYAAYVVLALVGVVVQLSRGGRGSAREEWSGASAPAR